MRIHGGYVTVVLALLCAASRAEDSGLIGHRMIVNKASNWRGVGGNNPYKRDGEVSIGTLTIPHNHKDAAAKAHVLGLRTLEVDSVIDGLTARTTVKHVFQNNTDALLEGVFTFALPTGAAVDRFAMTIVSESDLMEGSLIDKGNAKQIYSSLVYGLGVDPGVLEWVDTNTFRATIFPIPANGTKTIVVSFLEPLTPKICSDGHLEVNYRFPMIAGEDASSKLAAAQIRLRAQVHASAQGNGMVTASLQPKMEMSREGDAHLLAIFDHEQRPKDDWTITVRRALPAGAGACYLHAHRPDPKANGAFSITAIADVEIPPAPESIDAIFLVDTSASQAGATYSAAIKFVEGALSGLNAKDRFSIVTFDVEARPMPGGLLGVTAENIEKSLRHLRSIRPMGATDIGAAFTTAAREYSRDVQKNAYVIYVGDSNPTFGVKTPEDLEGVVGAALGLLKAEMTAVWSGTSTVDQPDASKRRQVALAALAKLSGGPVAEISPAARPGDMGKRLMSSLGAPVLKHAKIRVASDSEVELAAEPIGGMILDSAMRIFGQYAKAGDATVELSGMLHGKPYSREWKIRLPEAESANAAVAKLWARTMIERMEAGCQFDQARAFAQAQGVLSRDTAFLVLESEKMYAEYKIEREKKNLPPDELRSHFVAGVPQIREADRNGPQFADAMEHVRLSGKPALGTSSTAPLSIKETQIRVSLQDVRVEKQGNGPRPLTNRQIVERRLTLSRLIAAERMMPFEPETVFPKQWLTALAGGINAATQVFNPYNDAPIWTIVDTQMSNADANTAWRTNNFPVTEEEQVDRLMNPQRPSAIKLAPDNSSVVVDSHLLAHQILSWLLLPQSPRIYTASGSSEITRVIVTRKVQAYNLRGIDAEEHSAALNFLAQLAIVEHQFELAGPLADMAIAVVPASAVGDSARQSLLIKALSSHMRGNFEDAAKSYHAMLQGSKPLVKTAHALSFSALLTTMAVAGNTAGVIEVLEKWSQHEPQGVAVLDRLGEAYLYAGRRDEAIRAFSSAAEFQAGVADGIATPSGFLNRRKSAK